MKRILGKALMTVVLAVSGIAASDAQVYGKLNALYACVGVINPQVELRISPHSAFQTELVVSPWKSVFGGHHMTFGILMNEYRYFIGEKTRGLYVGANAGIQIFDISRPDLSGGLHLQNRYCKGYGLMFGACVGYEHNFAERWVLDAFIGFGYMTSWYNGYSLDGKIDMNPHRPEWKEPEYADPFNGSAEWLPNKIGISIGYRLFDPQKRK